MKKLLETLNSAQREAVEFNKLPHIIVAGAGSGKTRVLTYKIAYLLKTDYDPSSILALTFTNKAANEMKERIQSLVGDTAKKLWMGTFHSIFARILRIESEKLGYTANFSIYDREDSVSLVGNILNELDISLDGYTSSSIQHRISNFKNHMISPEDYADNIAKTLADRKIGRIYAEYNRRLKENNSMDFDDLLLKPIELFKSKIKTLQHYRGKFKYILVDEYQDTNKAQYEILKMLTSSRIKLCVVGDDAQSIYGWRGADISNMLNFQNDFKNAEIFRLEQNYRSTQNILKAADSIIKNNSDQIDKTLWTSNDEGEKLAIMRCSDEKDEAFQIAKKIKAEISAKKISFKEIAILYRINSQSRALEEALRREKIPYKIIGGVEFYRRKEIKDILGYLRVFANQNDEESLLRIMNFPQRGIGNTSITKMIDFSRRWDLTLFNTMVRVFEVIEVKERIQKNVKQFKLMLDKYISLSGKLSLYELISTLVDELGILRMYKEANTPESLQRLENVQELLSSIQQYNAENKNATLDEYLAEVSLVAGIDNMDDVENSITLMTVHSSKGLEFPIVILSGCEEDIFPLNPRFDSDSHIQEERRLFYVALTRAERKIYITHARSRYRFGEVAYQNRSRFIDEMDPETVLEINAHNGRKSGRKRKAFYDEMYQESYDEFNQEEKSFRVGSRVTHEIFGDGKILSIDGNGDMQKIAVSFNEAGVKHLLAKFANLKMA